MPRFDRVAILGLGLIGGSIGLALKRRRLARTVVGFSRRPSTLRAARRLGAVDVGTGDLRKAVAGADLVVLAVPVDAILPLARRMLPLMAPGSLLMDVGSTKERIVRALERGLPPGVRFVGTHPLAGSEQRGIAAADRHLLDGSACVLAATRRTDRRALRTAGRFWRGLGCRTVVMDPARHDRLLAAVSHLPHLLAFALARAAGPEALALAPRSFLDATRVAKSDPDLWDDIFLSNRPALGAAAARFERRWRRLRALIARGDRRALRRLLADAKAVRDALDRR